MTETPPPSDSDLVAAYRSGDTDAFAEIYERNADVVFSYFLERGDSREDAADAANNVFVTAADRLDAREKPADLRAWLLGIAAEGSSAGAVDHASRELLKRAQWLARPRGIYIPSGTAHKYIPVALR
jgi:hypothetical protein